MNAPVRSAAPTVRGLFSLVDHHGHDVDDMTYRGSYVLMVFGFTGCQVFCPQMLGKLSAALDRIGSLADQVRALCVTIDPVRDTPKVMRAFLEGRYPRFTGLTGSLEKIDAVTTAFRVVAMRGDEVGGRQMPQRAFTYVLDPRGTFIEHWLSTMHVQQMVLRLGILLAMERDRGAQSEAALVSAAR